MADKRKTFKPANRNIYRYYNGVKDVSVDPYKTLSKLQQVEGFEKECSIVWSESQQIPNKERCGAHEMVVKTIREVFGLTDTAFDEDGNVTSGYLDDECWDLLNDFYAYVVELKKNTRNSATSSPSTEPGSTTVHSPESNLSDSASISIVRSTEEPQPSVSEPA